MSVTIRREQLFGKPLGKAEKEVLYAVSEGMSAPMIARYRFVQPNTVRMQLRSVYAKLGARNRAHAVAIAMRHGWIV
jgi:DNA-binding CsgD family transcriptional regulator